METLKRINNMLIYHLFEFSFYKLNKKNKQTCLWHIMLHYYHHHYIFHNISALPYKLCTDSKIGLKKHSPFLGFSCKHSLQLNRSQTENGALEPLIIRTSSYQLKQVSVQLHLYPPSSSSPLSPYPCFP